MFLKKNILLRPQYKQILSKIKKGSKIKIYNQYFLISPIFIFSIKYFTLSERKTLIEYLKLGTTYREIAKIINKSISSISDEINRNGKRANYDPYEAEKRAQQHKHQRNKRIKLEILPGLKEFVIKKIQIDWSPEQIAG